MSKENILMRYVLVFIINIISSLYECFYLWENPDFFVFLHCSSIVSQRVMDMQLEMSPV